MKGIGRSLFSGLLIAVMAVAMACGGSSSGGSAKGDLRLIGGDPLTMDPAQASDSGSAGYIVEIFGGLVTLDQNAATRGRTRPVCEWPSWPKYNGAGDPNSASSFTCARTAGHDGNDD